MIWKFLNIDDQQLILYCQQKNRKAQNFLFEKYKKKVLFICMRYTSNIDEAKDILQETFIRVFISIMDSKKDHNIESLSSWIYKIASRTAIDAFRKKSKTLSLYEEIDNNTVLSQGPTPIENLSAEELLSIVQKMPDGYRIIFNMYVIEGYDHREIAIELGITKTTSRSQLTRAKEWLKNRIMIENTSNYERIFG